jgi:CRISPR-associated protein Csy1
MSEISSKQVREAIAEFLQAQLYKKLEPELKRLEKAEKDNKADVISAVEEAISKLRERYTQDNWMDNAANKMAGELNFGTHIAKGVHPDSKGDNVNFREGRNLPEGLVGSQTLGNLALDANGNAASLPLASFFNVVVDEVSGVSLRDLILQDHVALEGVFSSKPEVSKAHQTKFKAALSNEQSQPSTDERNKQLLWPSTENAAHTNGYTSLIPLHPSALTHAVFQKLNGIRYSETNKEARDNRKKKTAEQARYVSISDLAIKKLGGTKPQNISQLTSGQGGRSYLLPSLPPELKPQREFSLSRNQTTIFNSSLRYQCYLGLQQLFIVVKSVKNTAEWRDQRKEALDIILAEVLGLAANVQAQYAAGWSKDYQLDMAEKYWLDPKRAEIEEEDVFAERRANDDWIKIIEQNFSLWLNDILKRKFPNKKYEFADAEYTEWVREMRDAIKASQRTGLGILI